MVRIFSDWEMSLLQAALHRRLLHEFYSAEIALGKITTDTAPVQSNLVLVM